MVFKDYVRELKACNGNKDKMMSLLMQASKDSELKEFQREFLADISLRMGLKMGDSGVKVLEKKNGYTLAITNQGHGERIILMFPGETENNPHMWLGEPSNANVQKAKEVLAGLTKSKDSKTYDAEYINNFEEVLWKSPDKKIVVTRNVRDKNSKYIVRDMTKGMFKGMGQAVKECNTLNEAISFARSQKVTDEEQEFTYKVKIGADMKKITVRTKNAQDAKNKVQQEAAKLISQYKGSKINTKWD